MSENVGGSALVNVDFDLTQAGTGRAGLLASEA